MAAESRREQHSKHRSDADVPKPRDTKSQGIVRDQRGQEQPADKERAQQTSKNE
jgi:hypothetical protein